MGRISALTELTTLASDDYLVVLDSSANIAKKITIANAFGIPDLGFTASGESWTYASATTITVPTDATIKYTRGMIIKFTQATGGTKYAVILTVTATVLTIFMLNSATLVNEAITSPSYSSNAAPIGVNGIPIVGLGVIPTCSAYKSGNQTVTANTFAQVTWDSEFYDTAGIHSTSSNTSRFTVPTGLNGIWRVTPTLTTGSATGAQHLAIYKNGAIYRLQRYDVASAEYGAAHQSMELNLSAGDYVEIYVYTASTTVFGSAPPGQDNSQVTFTYVGRTS